MSIPGLISLSLPVHDPVLIVAIVMAAFLIMPLITSRLRLPDIIGVLVAGILVGPHGFGLLERDDTIHLLGTVGLLYLVFLAGLEVDLADLSRKRRRAISFGVLTFLVPQVVGTLGGLLFFGFSMPTAILLGSVFSSHSFLALLIAKRLGLTEREMTIAVIGGTVITDTLALLVLAGVAQTASGDFSLPFIVQLVASAALFAAALVFGLPIVGRWFFRHVADGGSQFAFMMTVLFSSGFVAHLIGLEPIIGAFLAGLGMNRLVPHHGVLANRAFFIGNTVFVPFFLLAVGMLIDLKKVVSDPETIVMAIYMTVTVILCKGAAAWLMRVLFGYRREDAVVAWGLSLPQAATTLAVVLVGYDLELFDDAILNATIVMVLVTCVLGPLLVQFAGRRLARSNADEEAIDQPDDDGFQRILIPLANPQSSLDLLDLAIALRRPLSDEPLLPVSVADHENQVATSERLLGASVLHLAAAEVPVNPVIRVDPNPVNGILRAHAESRATCMVVGWAGPEAYWQRHFHLNRGIIDELISETTGQLLVVRLTCPLSVLERVVLVLPPLAHAEPGFKELIGDAKRLAKGIGAGMTVCSQNPLSESLQRLITERGSKCPLRFEHAAAGLQDLIDRHADPHTFLCIVGCREGTISWDSGWSRATTEMAHRHREVSLAVAYPRVDKRPVTRQVLRRSQGSAILRQAVVRMADGASGLAELVGSALPVTLPATRLQADLLASISALNASVAMMHAATDAVRRPHLTILVLREAIELQALQVRVLVVLVNPGGTPPHEHLANLAAIATALGRQERLQALLAARDDDQARAALLEPVEGDG